MIESNHALLQLKQFDVPDWAQWAAQDSDGKWWAYSAEPHQHASGWYENEVGKYQYIGVSLASKNWREQLFRLNSI